MGLLFINQTLKVNLMQTIYDLKPEVISTILNNDEFKQSLAKIVGDVLRIEFLKELRPNISIEQSPMGVSVSAAVNEAIKGMGLKVMGIADLGETAESVASSLKKFNKQPTGSAPEYQNPCGCPSFALGGFIDNTGFNPTHLSTLDLMNNGYRGVSHSTESNKATATPENQAMDQKHIPAQMINVREGYQPLAEILALALEQAQNGKGNERHQVGKTPFIEQPICALGRLYGVGYNFGQASKKAHETQQLTSTKAKQAELLGAINYLAAAYLVLSEQE